MGILVLPASLVVEGHHFVGLVGIVLMISQVPIHFEHIALNLCLMSVRQQKGTGVSNLSVSYFGIPVYSFFADQFLQVCHNISIVNIAVQHSVQLTQLLLHEDWVAVVNLAGLNNAEDGLQAGIVLSQPVVIANMLSLAHQVLHLLTGKLRNPAD